MKQKVIISILILLIITLMGYYRITHAFFIVKNETSRSIEVKNLSASYNFSGNNEKILEPDEKRFYLIEMPKGGGDGSYKLTYLQENGRVIVKDVGYYTNGRQIEFWSEVVFKNDKVKIITH